MFDRVKHYYSKQKIQREIELSELEIDRDRITGAKKLVSEASNMITDQDAEKGWSIIGGTGKLTPEKYYEMLDSAYILYHTNTYARAIIRNYVKFTLGKGPLIIPDAEGEDKKQLKEAWEEFKEDNKFNLREKEIAVRVFRDGEVFIREYKNEKSQGERKFTIRFIRPEVIRNPKDRMDLPSNVSFGIRTDPDDIETVELYYITDDDGNFKTTLAPEEVIHFKILSDFDQKRGISVLKVAAKRLSQYDGWLEDRIFLNKIRSAIALVRKVPGSAKNLQTIRDDGMSDRLSQDRKYQKVPRRGTIITASKGVEYEMLSPNLNATDVAEDGRAMLLSVSAAMGFPEMILTADYSNANYSSTLIAQNPFVREIEDWQDQLASLYKEIYKRVIQYNIDHGELKEGTSTKCNVEFPPMIQADLEKLAKAYEILFKYKVVSKKTWQQKMGLDPDTEEVNMEEEPDEFGDGFDPNNPQVGGGSQFNLPDTPINQYGSQKIIEMLEMVKNEDFDSLMEMCEEAGGMPEEVAQKMHEFISNEQEEKINIEKGNKKDEEKREHELKLAEKLQPNINVNVDPAEVNINVDPAEVNITTPKNEINIGETKIEPAEVNINVEPAEVKVENKFESEKTVIENKIDPEIKIINEAPTVTVKPEINVDKTEVNIENIIEQKKSIKKVNRDKDGEVISIEESFEK